MDRFRDIHVPDVFHEGREDMEAIVKRCAGLDVHKEIIVACALVMDDAGKVRKSVKTFKTMTADPRRLRA